MDLDRMLEMCRRDQWALSDLDWTKRPRELGRDDEMAIVQLFTDMAAIERLAGAMFAEQKRRAKDPVLRDIFGTFVVDEARHAAVAERLARYYDRHRYRRYEVNRSLRRFTPHFLHAVRFLADDVANAYITGGELILDVALLRSINDHVADEMSASAMHLINRDESRHIAVDYHMVEYYLSDEYDRLQRERPSPSPVEQLRAARAFASLLYYARPFFRDVFFEPMRRVDPTGKRLLEAFKRFQLIGAKPEVQRRPFGRFLHVLGDLYNDPRTGPIFGGAIARLLGVEPQFARWLNTEEEMERARRMSMSELAEEALAAKYVN